MVDTFVQKIRHRDCGVVAAGSEETMRTAVTASHVEDAGECTYSHSSRFRAGWSITCAMRAASKA